MEIYESMVFPSIDARPGSRSAVPTIKSGTILVHARTPDRQARSELPRLQEHRYLKSTNYLANYETRMLAALSVAAAIAPSTGPRGTKDTNQPRPTRVFYKPEPCGSTT